MQQWNKYIGSTNALSTTAQRTINQHLSMYPSVYVWAGTMCACAVGRRELIIIIDKKAQLSLTNPRDACEKFARFT